MPQEALQDFDLPWCQAVFSDPAYAQFQHPHRVLPKSDADKASLLNGPLFSDKTIRACAIFYKKVPDGNDNLIGSEVTTLLSLGSDVGAYPGICHGGMIALMLDDVAGGLAYCITNSLTNFTVSFAITYVKRLLTPVVVRSRAWIEKPPEGRKLWMKCALEDGEGTIYAKADILYIITLAAAKL